MLRLTRESAIYAVGSVAGKAFGLLLLPILTRALAPEEYGRFDLLATLGSALVSGLLIGMDAAVLRLTFEPAVPRSRLFATWYALSTAIVVPAGLLLAFGSAAVSVALFGTPDRWLSVALVGGTVVFGTYQVIALAIVRALRRPLAYALLVTVSLAFNAVLTIALVLGVDASATMALAALSASLAVASLVGVFLIRGDLGSPPSRALARRLITLGLPLAPAVLLTWGAEFGNRAILVAASGPAEVGYLGVALRFASVAGLAVTGFQLAWEPHAFAVGIDDAGRLRLAADARRALVGVAIAVVGIAAVAPELVIVASGPAYAPALPALGLSLVGTLAAALVVVTATPSALATAMADIGAARAAGVVAAVGANLALARVAGGAGTAGALALGQLVTATLVHRLGSDRPALPVPWPRVLPVLIGAGAVALAITLPSGGAMPVVRIAAVLAFAVLLYAEGSVRDAMRLIVRR